MDGGLLLSPKSECKKILVILQQLKPHIKHWYSFERLSAWRRVRNNSKNIWHRLFIFGVCVGHGVERPEVFLGLATRGQNLKAKNAITPLALSRRGSYDGRTKIMTWWRCTVPHTDQKRWNFGLWRPSWFTWPWNWASRSSIIAFFWKAKGFPTRLNSPLVQISLQKHVFWVELKLMKNPKNGLWPSPGTAIG
jgi:hypothetical protein